MIAGGAGRPAARRVRDPVPGQPGRRSASSSTCSSLGLTGFLYRRAHAAATRTTLNSPPGFCAGQDPGAGATSRSSGPLLFDANVHRLPDVRRSSSWSTSRCSGPAGACAPRAVGEHPQAADTVGINVAAHPATATSSLGGAVAGLGRRGPDHRRRPAPFSKNMTAGNGFIALAAVIFGRWNPRGAVARRAALRLRRGRCRTCSPSSAPRCRSRDFLLMLPVPRHDRRGGRAGRPGARAPAADGEPYVKG